MDFKQYSIKDAFLPRDGAAPPVISENADIIGGVNDETLALLDRALGFCSRLTDDPLWNQRAFSLAKYRHWLTFDSVKLENGISALINSEKRRNAHTQ
jgi:hypothetical protein